MEGHPTGWPFSFMSQELTLIPLAEEVKTRVKMVEGEPHWLDLDLGQWLEFERPIDVRKLIRRHYRNLMKTGVIATVGITPSTEGGRPPTENWLSFPSCLFLCAKSQTEKANEVTLAMVQFIDHYRKGEVISQMGDTTMVGVKVDIQALARSTEKMLEVTRELLSSQVQQGARLMVIEGDVHYLKQDVEDIKNKVVRMDYYLSSPKAKRREISDHTKKQHSLVLGKHGGLCPICHETKIVDRVGEGQYNPLPSIRFDHGYSNQYPDLRHTWAICTHCHDQLTTWKVDRSGDNSALFDAYQGLVRRTIGNQRGSEGTESNSGYRPLFRLALAP
jgi:hypothetical protein